MNKKEQGITLVALVITIIIIIILSTVTINMVLGDNGLIKQAELVRDMALNSSVAEQENMNMLMEEYANVMEEDNEIPDPVIPPSTVAEAKPEEGDDIFIFEDTTVITDDLDNEVAIPGGFHVDEDSGTKVEEGVVIEDDDGNQFVWIPVGEYKTSSKETFNNKLTRRKWGSKSEIIEPIEVEVNEIIKNELYTYYGEENNNSIGNDTIELFKYSANINKGFYIGRFEAGTNINRTEETELIDPSIKKDMYPYVYITREDAKELSESMYSSNQYIKSELLNSYAWDTALNFICQNNREGYKLATTTDSTYGNIGTGIVNKTGSSVDKYSNIYDLLGNVDEWTTEYTIIDDKAGCVYRGFFQGYSYGAARNSMQISFMDKAISFRIILFLR